MAAPSDQRAQRNRHHLQEEDQEHQPPVRAQRFEDGDVEPLAVQERGHRFAGADAAHAQRGQSHQSEEHRHLLDKAADAGRGVVAVVDLPAGIGKSGGGLGLEASDCDAGLERDAIGIIDQASGLDQAGAGQRLGRDQHMRPQRKAGGDAVGLFVQGGDDAEGGVADA